MAPNKHTSDPIRSTTLLYRTHQRGHSDPPHRSSMTGMPAIYREVEATHTVGVLVTTLVTRMVALAVTLSPVPEQHTPDQSTQTKHFCRVTRM